MVQPAPAFEIILEDDHLVAVVKPAGLPTANAPRGSRSLFTLLQAARPGGFLGVVSRLDAAVSGVVVFAKTRGAAAELSRQFRERLVEKHYEAVVEGRFPAPLGQWVDWHDRIERQGQERRSRLLPGGGRVGWDGRSEAADGPPSTRQDRRHAGDADEAEAGACHVRCRVLVRHGEVSLVQLVPTTGRRHQLRAQLAGRGCPIVGDRTYNARLPFVVAESPVPSRAVSAAGPAIALHSRRLCVTHPATGRPLVLEAARPRRWQERFPGLFAAGHSRAGGG
jgi:23S rRNA pseudouridine1911/1915/1917 synthase